MNTGQNGQENRGKHLPPNSHADVIKCNRVYSASYHSQRFLHNILSILLAFQCLLTIAVEVGAQWALTARSFGVLVGVL